MTKKSTGPNVPRRTLPPPPGVPVDWDEDLGDYALTLVVDEGNGHSHPEVILQWWEFREHHIGDVPWRGHLARTPEPPRGALAWRRATPGPSIHPHTIPRLARELLKLHAAREWRDDESPDYTEHEESE